MLRASRDISAELLSNLARLTDGTAAESYSGFDGYLSGYPLPDGSYALSRTWRAHEIKRPGAVWTHVLLIEANVLAALQDPNDLLKLLRRPNASADLDSYRHPVALTPSADRVVLRTSKDWRALLSTLYDSDSGTIWRTADDAADIEPDILAIWWWQWPALRGNFSFCLGGSGRRKVSGRDFDLLIIPSTRRLSAVADFGVSPEDISASGTLINADLHGQMPDSFRAFLRFCGAETQRRGAAGLLSEIWMVAGAPEDEPTRVLRRVAGRIQGLYPSPSNMRRLKRTILMPDRRLPASWGRKESASLLIQTGFSDCVAATDVSIEDFLYEVRSDPSLLLQAARKKVVGAPANEASVITSSNEKASTDFPDASSDMSEIRASNSDESRRSHLVPVSPGSVTHALPSIAALALKDYAHPAWLEEIVQVGGETVVEVLLSVDRVERESWARAFWTLGSEKMEWVSSTYSSILRSNRGAESRSLGWLAAYTNPTAGTAWIARFHTARQTRRSALTDFCRELTEFSPDRRVTWRASVRDAALVREALEIAPQLRENMVGTLLTVTNPSSLEFIEAGMSPWMALSSDRLDPIQSAHLLRAAGRLDVPSALLASGAFAMAWEACAHSDWATWEALGDFPSQLGFGQDWDLARRVSNSYAIVLNRSAKESELHREDLISVALNAVKQFSNRAALQLLQELEQLSADRVEEDDPTALPKSRPPKSSKAGKGPIEQARRIASDWLGLS